MTFTSEEAVRVMALHALAYCERLFYLEEVEEIRVADDRVYAGRALHEEIRQIEEDADGWTSLELGSDALGLVGKVDALRRRDGVLVPYEHKRGRCRREGKVAGAWPSDALQVAAYAMLLEEETDAHVPEGRIRYHADKVTVRVPIDETARRGVVAAVERARVLRTEGQRPALPENDRLCLHCSLAPVCLPEEERLAGDPSWEPVRLFPPERERKVVHVVNPGTRVGRSEETLVVTPRDGPPQRYPVLDIGAVVLHGNAQITTQAVHMCASHEIAIHFVSAGGRYVSGLTPGPGPVQRRIRQFEALTDPARRLDLTRRLALAKVEAQLRYLLRATRGPDTAPEARSFADAIRSCLRGIARAPDVDVLRGHEGAAGRAYFGTWQALLRQEVPEPLRWTGRSRRPPRDRLNALLSFGYALVYQVVFQSIVSVGLDPSVGFFHTPRSSAHPLVLDLMELFRLSLWDIPLVGSINRMSWDVEADFDVVSGRVWLSDSGRRKAIRLFERRLEDSWKHPVVRYSLSYARVVELEVRLLEKEWTGSPGLFARMRLR